MTTPREVHLLSGLRISTSLGMELGPLDKPLVKKSDGKVIYADHLSTEELQEAYRDDPSVNVDAIVVDVVLGKKRISDIFRNDFLADYIIASHVIEHVPDLIGWLQDLRQALSAGGEIRLAVPDRRFTFDFPREVSCLADIMAAYVSKATRPQPRQVFDYYHNVTDIDLLAAWRGEIQLDGLKYPQRHKAVASAREAHLAERWFEIHCWVFTPFSFATLMVNLCELGLLDLTCSRFTDTQANTLEFFLVLSPSKDREEMLTSWQTMAASAHHHDPESKTAQRVVAENLLKAVLQRQTIRRQIRCGSKGVG